MISVIIPTYNRGGELLSCLDRLNKQTNVDFEVIIVDDSSDIEVTLNKAIYNFRVILHRNNKNEGASYSRNLGVSLSTGKWILFLDDDDLFVCDKVEIVLNEINNNPQADFLYHNAFINMVNENVRYITSVKPRFDLNIDDLLYNNYIGGAPVFVIKRDVFLNVGGFDTALPAIEDYELLLRLALVNPKVNLCFIDKVLTECFYYTKRASVSKNIYALNKAIDVIRSKHVTHNTAKRFLLNASVMLAHSHLMNLNRICALYYLKAFVVKKDIKFLFASIISSISPSLLILLRAKI